MEEDPKYVKTDQPGLVRDTYSQALVATDQRALMQYRERVEQFKKNQDKINSINTVKDDLDGLKKEMNEIKNLLVQIVNSKEE